MDAELIERIRRLHRIATRHPPISSTMLQCAYGPVMTVEDLLNVSDAVGDALWSLRDAYRELRVTPNLPDDLMMEALRARLNDVGERAWCLKIRGLGGPAINHLWIRHYSHRWRMEGLVRVDRRIRQALVLEDAQTVTEGA